MSITMALKKNQDAVSSTITDYQTNVITVCMYAASVLKSSLPTLMTPPPDWESFQTAYSSASAAALNWTNSVMGQLLSMPQSVQSYHKNITSLLSDASDQAALLVINPNDSSAQQQLAGDLTQLSGVFNLVATFIASAADSIEAFDNMLPQQAADLQLIATNSLQAANADQAEIMQLQDAIDALNDQIKQDAIAIGALVGVDAVAIVLGTVATIAAFPVGALTWLLFVPIIAVATTFLALDAYDIQQCKQNIDAAKAQMSGLTAECAVLQATSSNFSTLATQSQNMGDVVQAVLEAWQTLEADMSQAINDINQTITDEGLLNWSDVATDLATATNDWQATYQQAGSLALTPVASDANVEIGMSASLVQQTISTTPTIPFLAWLNAQSSSI